MSLRVYYSPRQQEKIFIKRYYYQMYDGCYY